ncbi:MAG: CDP-alcohol phosphatidyltransferase family protein [Chloroflexi bacterium]|nr:CDP-alcohol phosphatidyltransferase family protein [Chloroflexota bacterium]
MKQPASTIASERSERGNPQDRARGLPRRIRSAEPPRSGLKAQITFTDRLRINFRFVLDPAVEFLDRTGVHPNYLTAIGVIGTTAAAYLVSQSLFTWAGLLILLVGPVDALDGALARRRGEQQAFGAFVDSVADRYSELALYAGLLWVAQAGSDWRLSFLVYFAAFGSVLVSYVRARAQSLGMDAKGGLLTRVERFIIMTACLIFNIPFIGVGILAIGTNLTAIQRIWHVRQMSKHG